MLVERTCIVCRTKKDKTLMTRIVLNKLGQLNVQKNKKLDGRGAYICNDASCLDKMLKTKALNRTFKHNFNEQVYQDLLDEIKKA